MGWAGLGRAHELEVKSWAWHSGCQATTISLTCARACARETVSVDTTIKVWVGRKGGVGRVARQDKVA